MILTVQQQAQPGFFELIGDRFEEGGFFIMMFIFIVLILGIFLLVRGGYFASKKDPKIGRTIILLNSIGLFALVLGVFGQLIKLIETLDYLSSFEDTTPRDFAQGLKFTMLPTLFGALVFLCTRFSTIVLNWVRPIK